jgi:hypothetical protein
MRLLSMGREQANQSVKLAVAILHLGQYYRKREITVELFVDNHEIFLAH